MIKKTDIIAAIISGGLLTLGFPPYDYFPLAWIALIPLLFVIVGKKYWTSFLIGTIAGLAYFLGTIYWMYHSMFYYGGLSLFMSILLLFLLCMYLSLYVAFFSVFFNYLYINSRTPALILVPVIWVSFEYLRTYALTGFPWALIGYTQYTVLPLIQVADITGVYGISFLLAALNGVVFDVISWPRRMEHMPLLSRWPMISGLAVFGVIIVITLFYGSGKLNEKDNGRKVKASVIQGNVSQDQKWDSAFQQEAIAKYKRLTAEASSLSPDIIIWPETAVPFNFGYDKALTSDIVLFQQELGTHLLFGSVIYKDEKSGRPQVSNSAIMLSPEGNIVSVYDKIHLVPYGEYVPLRSVLPFVDKLTAGIGDFTAGKKPVVMETPFSKIGNLICYEIIFPDLVRKFVYNGANVLVTITNDAWFGRTSAPYQHFAMAVFRAIENRVPVARAANTGISGFIDSRGRIINKSEIFIETALTEDLSLGEETSFYTTYGDYFAYLCVISFVLLLVRRRLAKT